MKFDAPLKLTQDGDIAFDFPEKPKPIETNVLCPKCGRPLKKTQWKYECECGFNVWHTVAKVELSEEILTELFTTGKTKKKVTGFTSKAGNVFDTCLKFENDQISFDFDNPGEEEVQSTADVQSNTEAQRNADAQSTAEDVSMRQPWIIQPWMRWESQRNFWLVLIWQQRAHRQMMCRRRHLRRRMSCLVSSSAYN